jgi:ATPase involved in DNA replication initiation
MENFWSTCLSRFEQELSKQQYNTWIKPLVAEVNGNALRLVAPNRFVLQWVKDRFNKKIEQFARELQLNDIQIDFVIANIEAEQADKASEKLSDKIQTELTKMAKHPLDAKPAGKKTVEATKVVSGLNSAFNFDNYVTGRANQLARAAAMQVAENPGAAYNPLFIYGGGGFRKNASTASHRQ